MKNSPIYLTALLVATLLLSSCTNDHTADSAATTAGAGANASTTHDMAGATHSAMDHAAMGHGAAGASEPSPQLTAMNEMMQQMHATTPTGNTDYDFARHMLEHHKGAVVMADIELRDGQDATMRRMAEQIKADQQQEIRELTAAAARLKSAPANYQPENPADPFSSKMKASMDGMMQDLPQPATDPDLSFNQLMTVHHQSAVDMAQAQLAHGRDPQLKKMAQQMITAQQQEIQQFKAWHAANANKQ
ncbi:DUF305 domain-containing protein [Hymenobacter sp. 5516J-16]|uniref:DUF305 domain-containing protein n=1 Tax=Hymenobacter sp. 5516J-16 TaxID=2932253 RepID=UPI001FD562BF|nr:DUF305 domain-containing protein [Hymenobacter sp. 5516J-16]UOQ77554.1 DUF305 domain-containing protein [Hymenobacter sp. 5516J-16]